MDLAAAAALVARDGNLETGFAPGYIINSFHACIVQ